MKKLIQYLLTGLLPHACLLCHHPANHRALCDHCLDDLPRSIYACPRCARPIAHFKANFTCNYCLKHSFLPFDKTFALFLYQQPVTKLIMDIKFGQSLSNANLLGTLMADKIRQNWYQTTSLPTLILPIPLHPLRLKQRGYNQAIEIARPISKLLKIPMETQVCQRLKHTAAQATLSAIKRAENIKNAFVLTKSISEQHIAVIDDVITTGGTVFEFCQVLKQGGAKRIDVWCAARPR